MEHKPIKMPNLDNLPDPAQTMQKRLMEFYDIESINVARVMDAKATSSQVTEEDLEKLKKELIRKFPDNFISGTPTTRINANPTTIELVKGAELPPKVFSPRAIPIHHLHECKKAFKQYLDAGVVRKLKANEIPLVINPTFFLPKADGVRQRLLTDFKKLNEIFP